jgi:hypothetical protein
MWTGPVQTIQIINSVKIDVYAREHLPPHFHAIYGEHEVLIEILTLFTYAGWMPARQHRLVLRWAAKAGVKKFLLNNFIRLNPNLRK